MVTPVTVFSDFACPASYVTEAALWELGEDVAAVRYRAFELYPDGGSVGTSRFGEAQWDELQRLARQAGLVVRPQRTLPKTRKAHEGALFARERGCEAELRRAIFSAVWDQGRDIGRIDVLSDLGGAIGLDGEDLRIALDIDRYEAEVETDLDLARRLHVPGTPVLFVGTGHSARVVAGARTPDEIRAELQAAESKNETEPDHV